jgi:hypothetical protein
LKVRIGRAESLFNMTESPFIGLCISIGIAFAVFVWSKPTCRDGYIPIGGVLNGWVCVSGYKP